MDYPEKKIPSDDRKLIQIWIELEKQREKDEDQAPLLAVDEKIVAEIEKAIEPVVQPRIPPADLERIKNETTAILKNWVNKVAAERPKTKLPSQYEREQKIMNFRRLLSPDVQLISPNAFEKREDIFKPRVRKEAEVKSDFISTEGNPDVSRVENWAIWAYALGMNGGDASWSGLYWRYRIYVPNFDTSIQPDRTLVVTPRAVLNGYYSIFASPIIGWFPLMASVAHRYYTGIWHWHYSPNGYEPEWVGWRRSYDVVSQQVTSYANIYQAINIGYPGTAVATPMVFDPPGRKTSPNPVNKYALVRPYDCVDFYVRPEVRVETIGFVTYAKIDFSLIDVPFVTVEYQTGYDL